VTISATPTPVVASGDYYPFGLTFNSYKRENSVENRIKFQGQEHVDDLGLNWDSFKWRNHQPDIGRFFNVDPLSDKYVFNSPYAFSENHVISHVELEGLEKLSFMVALFEPNKGADNVYTETTPTNTTVDQVSRNSSDQVLHFTADYGTGKITNVSGQNHDTNMWGWAYDKLTGQDPYKLDFKMETEGKLNITVTIGDATFTINGKADGSSVVVETTISNVDEETGAVIKVDEEGKYFVSLPIGLKKGGSDDSSSQKETIPLIEKDGSYTIDTSWYLEKDEDKEESTTTTTK
jgi:RHS repeat-associated protein